MEAPHKHQKFPADIPDFSVKFLNIQLAKREFEIYKIATNKNTRKNTGAWGIKA